MWDNPIGVSFRDKDIDSYGKDTVSSLNNFRASKRNRGLMSSWRVVLVLC